MSWIVHVGVNEYLTDVEKDNNAIEFYNFFAPRGYTLESICGMLGNIDQESNVNPGLKETSSMSSGWGLIQWTPMSNFIWWFQLHGWDWYDGVAQCEKIAEEIESNRDPWLPTAQYPYSGQEFTELKNVETAMYAYFYERERGDVSQANFSNRLARANYYYQYLSGQPVPPTPPTPIPDIQAILMLLCKRRRLKPWS